MTPLIGDAMDQRTIGTPSDTCSKERTNNEHEAIQPP
jgi:hypothetical protein